MRVDLLIAATSAGLLVYSGRLLVPTARFRPEDIIPDTSAGPSDPFGAGMAPWSVFPENNIVIRIRDVLDGKVGFDLLVFGTIGGVVAVIVGAFTLSWNVPSALDITLATVMFVLGYGAGWWWKTRSGWYGKQERRLLVHCFLAWLEHEVGDPKAKHQEFGLTVVTTARKSGFTLMKGLQPPLGAVLTDADDMAAAHRIVALAREHRYQWRRDDFRQWAREVASKRP